MKLGAVKRPSTLIEKVFQIRIANADGRARIHIQNVDAESFREYRNLELKKNIFELSAETTDPEHSCNAGYCEITSSFI